MIPTKTRESRRVKALKLPKNLERLYKEGKCRECAVVVNRMDFAKILGKFTKVKIKYESSTTPKTKQNANLTSPNTRLKSNENGMVLVHRKAYGQRPVKELLDSKSTNNSKSLSPIATNILKENNRLKKPILKDKISNYDDQEKKSNTSLKQYSIVFEDPLLKNNNNDINCKISLSDLLPHIDDSILPSKEWCIDFFPKNDEPKDDQVYDRIAAELEDLMYNEKPIVKLDEKPDNPENKVDDFPSIMDILNDNSSENKSNEQNSSLEFKSNLESSDVEAMLLGKSNSTCEPVPATEVAPTPMDVDPTPLDVDNTNMGNLIEDVNQLSTIEDSVTQETVTNSGNSLPASVVPEELENPHSPSILDEALQKGIEEHLPIKHLEESSDRNTEEEKSTNETEDIFKSTDINVDTQIKDTEIKVMDTNVVNENSESNENVKNKERNFLALKDIITHVVFKMTKGGVCSKSVTCPKNLKYCIEINEKAIEFIGAPKFITSLEDLQVLLQIVNESELDDLYVLH